MHIKQITISNFRSFKQQPEIHPFSPGTNSVVGRNGSGKSNLFDAVQFVLLSPRFYSLRAEERQALLHEGSGTAAVNAFVEVVFDNSDNRFSLDSDEVVLRRTVGPKKDEFFLQRKRATKQEISSLLEGAGFSKSNPYFMIQQGKIQDICTMRDDERLALLKQVAGTTVYDEKKQESLMKMEENNSSIEKIHAILQDIEERLQELHGEKEELTTYQQLDRKRRAMEYTLYDKELRRARNALEQVEHDRYLHVEEVSALHERSRQAQDAIRNIEATMKTKSHALRRNTAQLAALEANKNAAVKHHTAINLVCQELRDTINTTKRMETTNQRELEQVEAEILQAQNELEQQVEPEYQQACDELQQENQQRDQNKRQIDGLVAKKGRGSHFSTKAERDAYLKTSIQEIEATLAEKESTLVELHESLGHVRRTVTQETTSLQTMTTEVAKEQETLQALKKNVDALKNERLVAHQKKQDAWRQTEEINDRMREAREAMHKALSDARKVMPRATALGLEALDRIVDHERLVRGEQFFGMLMDNFSLQDPKYHTAVEIAAQNSLFHVIVDTDATAAKLMKRLEDGKLGRVTFLPLNRLRVDNVQYPQETADVKPLLSHCLEYDPRVARAMEHVFSRKLLARDAEVAADWSAKAGMDAITLEGDLCSRKGALTGGYVDTNKSRMRAHENQAKATATLSALEKEYRESKAKSQQVEQVVTELNRKLQQQEGKHSEFTKLIRQKENAARSTQKKIDSKKKEADKLEREKIPPLELEISGLQSDVKRLQDEMKTALTSTLSDAEKKQLHDLKEADRALKIDIEKQTDLVSRISLRRQQLQSRLNDNLLRRRGELKGMFQVSNNDDVEDADGNATSPAAVIAQKTDELQEKQQELQEAERIMQEMEERLEEVRQTESQIRAEISARKGELEKYKGHEAQYKKDLDAVQDKAERLLNKRQMHIAKREAYSTKIQELGALPPPSERQSFQSKSISDLMKSLDVVNKKLKKYSHVNKKAFDQFVNFSEQRDALLKRKDELDQGAEKVKECIERLDLQKDEAIIRTFKGVRQHFRDVFKELVPNGSGRLHLRRDGDDPETDDEDDETGTPHKPENKDVSKYRGVEIKVRFSPIGENYMMQQLSGGQKALVALALIFSIQRCDPAPFYLFDELDQALDSAYRASVAGLIQKQATSETTPTQFIVSTFRPELVEVANRCYGISHQNKESNFHHLGKKESLEFVANLMSEEETLEGELVAKPESRKRKATNDGASEDATVNESTVQAA